jgi:hypothetical protein
VCKPRDNVDVIVSDCIAMMEGLGLIEPEYRDFVHTHIRMAVLRGIYHGYVEHKEDKS